MEMRQARGQEFQQVAVQGVTFGGVAATSFTVVGPNVIRATYPPGLTPGRHPVRLQTSYAALRHFAPRVLSSR